MKQSIGVVLFAALVCLIAQPGFAADFVFRVAGIQVNKLPADVEKAKIECQLYYQTPGGENFSKVQKELPVTQTQDGRSVLSGPFEVAYDNIPQRDAVNRWGCTLFLFKSGYGWLLPVVCDPADPSTVPARPHICVDRRYFNKVSLSGVPR